jgi:hypothetical protein
MNTPEYQRSIRRWDDWELFHFGGRQYALHRLYGKVWFPYQQFRAVDETVALARVKEIVAEQLPDGPAPNLVQN